MPELRISHSAQTAMTNAMWSHMLTLAERIRKFGGSDSPLAEYALNDKQQLIAAFDELGENGKQRWASAVQCDAKIAEELR